MGLKGHLLDSSTDCDTVCFRAAFVDLSISKIVFQEEAERVTSERRCFWSMATFPFVQFPCQSSGKSFNLERAFHCPRKRLIKPVISPLSRTEDTSKHESFWLLVCPHFTDRQRQDIIQTRSHLLSAAPLRLMMQAKRVHSRRLLIFLSRELSPEITSSPSSIRVRLDRQTLLCDTIDHRQKCSTDPPSCHSR